ncbi:MAG: HAMP domain-containing histidine kinase, partial [Saprospiraceae bacterium]|nr:HAMP domain-containing histidine kinase [Saprospiraceae bacterium]
YLKALELNKKAGVSAGVIRVATALGQHYSSHGQPVLGLRYIREARKAAVESKDFYLAAISDLMESEHWYAQKDYPQALIAIDACLRYFEEQKDPRLIQGAYQQKALVLKELGQLDAAVEWAQKELEQARQANSLSFLLPPYQLLAEIEKERGNYKEALGYQEQYTLFKDSVYHKDLEGKLAEERTKQNIEAESEARKKAELEAELLTSRNQLFVTIAGALLLFLLIGGYLFWQLRKSKRQLQTQNTALADLNATKDKFFGIIAHDLRNPLSAFQGIGEQLHYYLEKGDTAKLRFISTNIAKSATNLNGLLDNLLSWALLNRGMIPYQPEPLNVAEETAANLAIHENAAQAKSIQMENEIPPELQVLADRNALQAILRNMIGNAIKFTPTGGRVRLTAESQNDQVSIRVEDTGTGISAEKLDKVFSLDKRSEHGTAGEKGAGLGLMLCKELVAINKGSLTASSVVGAGSVFTFTLPKMT